VEVPEEWPQARVANHVGHRPDCRGVPSGAPRQQHHFGVFVEEQRWRFDPIQSPADGFEEFGLGLQVPDPGAVEDVTEVAAEPQVVPQVGGAPVFLAGGQV
jgi:hypothetical protein